MDMPKTETDETPITYGDAYRLMRQVHEQRVAAGENWTPVSGWDAWWSELKALAAAIKYPFVHDGNEECWRDYFNEQNTPMEAIKEDMSYLD